MNPYKHSEISVANRGGCVDDYYAIHFFSWTRPKNCGSDNRHRILHNLWAVRRIVIPIFGSTIHNSDGKQVNTKDLCEQDHILADYRGRFIPTLGDFVSAIEEPDGMSVRLDQAAASYARTPQIRELLLSPLYLTGQRKSLMITCNSWFLGSIVPQVFSVEFDDLSNAIAPAEVFESMKYRPWMDNGASTPPSYANLQYVEPNSIPGG